MMTRLAVSSPPRETGALLVAIACASMSGAALLAHHAGLLRLPFFITFISLPSSLALVALHLWAKRWPWQWLARRIWAGCWIGPLGTLAYDVTRGMLVVSGIYTFQPFRVIVLLGVLITGEPETAGVAIAAGWIYHLWNGVNFAVIYVLAVGRGWWPLGVVWGMALEVLMLATFPGLFRLPAWDVGFMATSLIGHVAYGLVLGLLAQRQKL